MDFWSSDRQVKPNVGNFYDGVKIFDINIAIIGNFVLITKISNGSGHCIALLERVLTVATSHFRNDFALQIKLIKLPLIPHEISLGRYMHRRIQGGRQGRPSPLGV